MQRGRRVLSTRAKLGDVQVGRLRSSNFWPIGGGAWRRLESEPTRSERSVTTQIWRLHLQPLMAIVFWFGILMSLMSKVTSLHCSGVMHDPTLVLFAA